MNYEEPPKLTTIVAENVIETVEEADAIEGGNRDVERVEGAVTDIVAAIAAPVLSPVIAAKALIPLPSRTPNIHEGDILRMEVIIKGNGSDN